MSTFAPGDRVRTTAEFGETYPRVIDCNDGRPLAGVVIRTEKEGRRVVVHWDGRVHEVTIPTTLVEPEQTH